MMQIYRYFKFTDFIICKFARKFVFTAFRYTLDDVDDDDDDDANLKIMTMMPAALWYSTWRSRGR